MKPKTNLHYVTINSGVVMLISIFQFLLQFINRSIFLSILGLHLLGVTNFINSIIGVFSLAELGIGSAITYELYQPIAEGNIAKRNAYLRLFQKSYRWVAFSILFLGVIALPFIPYFSQEKVYSFSFLSIYFLLLVNSVATYLFSAYKRSLLEAQQQRYVYVLYDFFIFFIFCLIKWATLYITGDYLWFLLLNLLCTVVSNCLISWIVDRHQDITLAPSLLKTDEKERLKKNVLGGFSNKFATVIVFSTDNLLISKFIGIDEVGIYGNYSLISSSLLMFLSRVADSHIASIGNLIVTEEHSEIESFFRKYHFLNFAISYYLSLMILVMISPFVSLWLGERILLAESVVRLIALYFFVQSYRNSFLVFIGGYGLYWAQRKKALLEAFANIAFSLAFLILFSLGLEGILLGTVCSNVFINLFYEPYILYKHGLKKSLLCFVPVFLKQTIFYLVMFGICLMFPVHVYHVWDFFVAGVSYTLFFCLAFVLFYSRSIEGSYFLNELKKRFIKS